MRILIIVDCYLPSPKSGAKLIHDLGVEFRRQGNEVTVLTASDLISERLRISCEEGLQIIRVRTKKIKGAKNFLRALQEVRLSSILWRRVETRLRQLTFDLIMFYSPTIFFGALVRRLKSIWGCPAYLILRDIFPEWAVNAGILRRGMIYRFFRRKEIEQYEAADIIAVQSPANLQYFAREFPMRRYPLEVLYNWAALHESNLPATNYRVKLGLQDKIVFFYGGNLGVAQDIGNLFRLASRLSSHNEIHFLLVGEGSEVTRLDQMIAEKKLGNIQILPAVSQQEYMSLLSEADVGLISLDRRLQTHNIPGKLLGYMYWGKPILASINPGNDLFEILHANQAGLCLKNGEDENLGAAAIRLASDPNLRARMGRNSRRVLERTFSSEVAVREIMVHLAKLKFAGEPTHVTPPRGAIAVGHRA
jgi:glycosyltransferase involved in cell wall biosynthesis